MNNEIICGNALTELQKLEPDSIDLIVTDPPYGYSFMNKDWDKAVVSVDIWKQCLRVLKAGAFAFVMSSPRQDVLSRMICNLQDAGFETNFTSIYWTYSSGFPKAADVSKLVDKRNGKNYNPEFRGYVNSKRLDKGLSFKDINEALGYSIKGGNFASDLLGDKLNHRFLLPSLQAYQKLKQLLDLDDRFDELIEREEAEREIIGNSDNKIHFENLGEAGYKEEWSITKPATPQAQALEGAYAGFQPKPAVECILVVMKPLSEKTYVDQALANGKGCTWLDNARIPYQSEQDIEPDIVRYNDNALHCKKGGGRPWIDKRIAQGVPVRAWAHDQKGRFPANLLVSDDCLNDGRIYKSGSKNDSGKGFGNSSIYGNGKAIHRFNQADSGSYSRYFDLDKWFDTTFPFIITPKASKSEKNMGLDKWMPQNVNDGRQTPIDNPFQRGETPRQNIHPTCKPLKLMSWLITLGSRPNDIVLDPFCGSGTTCIAAKMLKRRYIGIELNQEYADIANARVAAARVAAARADATDTSCSLLLTSPK